MELIVPDDKLSLAIGKKGQNVRLASQLTGWRIDIHSESKIQELEARAKMQIASVDGVGDDLAETIFRLGWRSVADISRGQPEELAQVPGVGGVEAARRIIEGARRFLEGERARSRRDSAPPATPGGGGGEPVGSVTMGAAPGRQEIRAAMPNGRLDEGWEG